MKHRLCFSCFHRGYCYAGVSDSIVQLTKELNKIKDEKTKLKVNHASVLVILVLPC